MASNDESFLKANSSKKEPRLSTSSYSPIVSNANRLDISNEKTNGQNILASEKLDERLTKYLLQTENQFETENQTVDQFVHTDYTKSSRWFINMKCTDSSLAAFSFFVGVTAILLQVMSLGSDYWIYTVEPRTVGNVSDHNGEPKDFLFIYNSGYWRICRQRYVNAAENSSNVDMHFYSSEPEFQRFCLNWNRPPNGSDDHLGFSKASGAILNRTLLSAILHIVSLTVTGLGMGLSIAGHFRRDTRTFVAAILYIMSGILMSVAVMQYICVVDDEMAPKMKQTPEGEESKYKAYYGWSYMVASMSFMCIETCALVELLLFLRRFPSLEDKMTLVPGLKDKIRRAVLHHEFDDILPARTCSRSSPRISFSYTPQYASETVFS